MFFKIWHDLFNVFKIRDKGYLIESLIVNFHAVEQFGDEPQSIAYFMKLN